MKARPLTLLLFVLAEKLGKTVGELRREMSGRELDDWAVYFAIQRDEEQAKALEREAEIKVNAMMAAR